LPKFLINNCFLKCKINSVSYGGFMISKCPECGRSYPTHHGKICKLCAAKGSSAPAAAELKAEPVAAAAVVATPEKQEAPAPTPTAGPRIQAAPVQDFGFNPYLGGSLQTKAPSAKPEGDGASTESDSSQRVCPYCEYENDPSDVFCRGCEKMIIKAADGNKLKEYQLTDLKGTIPDQIAKLKKIGINTTLQLLDKGSSPTKRKTLSIKTGISETFLIRLIHQTDLLRINSIDPAQTYILETVGINSLKLLERKSAKEVVEILNKQKAMLNSKKILVLPGEKTISTWLDDLKKLVKVVI
jgi:hypothetical protein